MWGVTCCIYIFYNFPFSLFWCCMQGIVESGEDHVLWVRWRLWALILQRQCMRMAYDWGVNRACLCELWCCFPISKIITLSLCWCICGYFVYSLVCFDIVWHVWLKAGVGLVLNWTSILCILYLRVFCISVNFFF